MNERQDMNMNKQGEDPLGLGDLPLIDPPGDGWDEIQAALLDDRRARRRSRRVGGMAVAASLLAVIGFLVLRGPSGTFSPATPPTGVQLAGESPGAEPDLASQKTEATEATEATVSELIVMSQVLEQRLRRLRDNTAAMPAESVVYVTELEDLVARVDSELSLSPESIELWSQRVNLLLDLEALFQHQFENEYGRMASL